MVIAMALRRSLLVQKIGKPVTYIHSLLRYMHPDIHDDIWAPHRALGDGTLGPGSSTLHTWAKVHHPGPYPGTHPLPPCSLLPRHRHTHTHAHRQGRKRLGKDVYSYRCTVARWRVPLAEQQQQQHTQHTDTQRTHAHTHASHRHGVFCGEGSHPHCCWFLCR